MRRGLCQEGSDADDLDAVILRWLGRVTDGDGEGIEGMRGLPPFAKASLRNETLGIDLSVVSNVDFRDFFELRGEEPGRERRGTSRGGEGGWRGYTMKEGVPEGAGEGVGDG
jgi:hypothetical protein